MIHVNKNNKHKIVRQWLVDAYHHYKKIQNSIETVEAGVQEVSGYVFSSKFPEVTKVVHILCKNQY